jgi:hypothetical protein
MPGSAGREMDAFSFVKLLSNRSTRNMALEPS